MIQLPIEIGDAIRVGRFKNKRIIVKDISFDENGLPLINGRGILKIRIEKLLSKKEINEMKSKKELLENLIRKIIREEKHKLNEGMTLDQAKKEAIKISKENGGAVQHIDEHGPENDKYYTVSDWMSDDTVCTIENGRVR